MFNSNICLDMYENELRIWGSSFLIRIKWQCQSISQAFNNWTQCNLLLAKKKERNGDSERERGRVEEGKQRIKFIRYLTRIHHFDMHATGTFTSICLRVGVEVSEGKCWAERERGRGKRGNSSCSHQWKGFEVWERGRPRYTLLLTAHGKTH